MIIGFTKQVQTVSESDVASENGTFQTFINVSTDRVSEIEHVIQFRLLEAKSRATVVSFEFMGSFDFDARFGTDDQDLIVETYHLNPGESQIMSLVTEIINDVIPEGEECYSISISPGGFSSLRDEFTCSDEEGFFCEHTICIEDDGI